MYVGSRTRNVRIDYGYQTVSDETIREYAAQALERPADSGWRDSELWDTHTLMFYSAPDSDDLIAQSNHRSILEDLGGAYAKFPGAVERARIGHWTYSHFDCIKVRVTYANGEIHPAFADAVQILKALEDYPLYSEDDHSDLESEIWDKAINDAATYALESEDDAAEIRDDVIRYLWSEDAQLQGWHDCGYVPDETIERAIDHARALYASAQAVGLIRPNDSGERLTGL